MSFSPEWLALREPADHAAINAEVRMALVDRLAAPSHVRIVDLGCGAGSNLRSLAPRLGLHQDWTLVDYDSALLGVARDRLAEIGSIATDEKGRLAIACGGRRLDIEFRQADFSSGDFVPLLAGADLVTAAALFDLVSVAVIEKLVAAVTASRQIFATVLTYDGIAAWLPSHPADNAMRDAFNRHQHGDKGFGPAAGPDATDALAAAFTRHGYRVLRGKSPWVLDRQWERLRHELDRGWAGAVLETGDVAAATVESWLAHRMAAAGAVTIVGHEDLLAVPPD